MVYIGLFISILLGICVCFSISQRLKIIELLGLAFPVGIGTQTFLMVWMDLFGVRFTRLSVLLVSLLFIIGLTGYLYKRRESLKEWIIWASKFTFPKFNLFWLLCIGAIIVVVVMNMAKTMYFPTFDTDSIRGFNLVGMAIAHEGTIKGLSIFTDINYSFDMVGHYMYTSYTPLVQAAYAYVYILGTDTSKIINALFFLSFIPVFYGVLSRFATHTLTALATLFAFVTPEMLAFSSLSGTNFIHALYASLGILFFVAWYYKKIPSFLWISAILLALNCWTRSEGIVFIAASSSILLWESIKNKSYKRLIFFTLIAVFPLIFWNVFLKINHFASAQVFIMKPFWDGEKAAMIAREVWKLFNGTTYYGLTFILFLFILLSNVWNIYKKRDQLIILLLTCIALSLYTLVIYQIDYVWDSLLNVLLYSYKRFLFSFIPLLWFYMAANRNMAWLFEKVDNWLYPIQSRKKK